MDQNNIYLGLEDILAELGDSTMKAEIADKYDDTNEAVKEAWLGFGLCMVQNMKLADELIQHNNSSREEFEKIDQKKKLPLFDSKTVKVFKNGISVTTLYNKKLKKSLEKCIG